MGKNAWHAWNEMELEQLVPRLETLVALLMYYCECGDCEKVKIIRGKMNGAEFVIEKKNRISLLQFYLDLEMYEDAVALVDSFRNLDAQTFLHFSAKIPTWNKLTSPNQLKSNIT